MNLNQPNPKKMRLKQTKSQRQARLNPPIHNQYKGPSEQGRLHNQETPRKRARVRSVTPRQIARVGPGIRTRNPSLSHRVNGLALLFLITTVTPSVDGSIISSNPETPSHEYAQAEQKVIGTQELETANALSTEQILLIGGAIVITILHLNRWKSGSRARSLQQIHPKRRISTGSNTITKTLEKMFPRDGLRATKEAQMRTATTATQATKNQCPQQHVHAANLH
jgi:hypothetical protein